MKTVFSSADRQNLRGKSAYPANALHALRLFLQGGSRRFACITLLFCRWAHAAPLHPPRCHRHFCTFSLHALYGVGLPRLMWRNPAPRFRLLWRKPGFVLRHDCRIRGKPPPEPPCSSAHASSLLGLLSANALQADCSHKTPTISQKLPKIPKNSHDFPKIPTVSQISDEA